MQKIEVLENTNKNPLGIRVRKRDGSYVEFDKQKIVNAILSADKEVFDDYRCGETLAIEIANEIERTNRGILDVEVIQDLVLESLNNKGKFDLAICYSNYRRQREIIRSATETEKSVFGIIRNENLDVSTENSNKDARIISTQRDYMAGEMSKDLTKKYFMSEDLLEAEINGILHMHDLDYQIHKGMFNCCLVNIDDMLTNGTVMNGKMIESPHTFRVACTVATQIMAAVASNQYGGQSMDIRHFGKFLRRTYDKEYKKAYEKYQNRGFNEEDCAKYAKEDALLERQKDLEAGVQTMQYQINTLMTTNGQSPFVTLFLNIDETNEYVEEIAMIVEEILKQRIKGIKNDKGVYVTPAFPKLIYVLYPHNNLTGGKYDYITKIACECSAKRMYPDYISSKKMKENYEGNVFACMGCRSFLSPWKDENGNYKFEGRFNQGVVSINLPQIGIIAKGNEEIFWSLLDKRLELCFKALMLKHKILKGATSDVSPVHWQYGAIARLKPGEKIDKLLFGGYSSISLGYIGIYETTILMKGCSHTDPVGTEFALRLMTHLYNKTQEWKKKTNIGFALYGTPAESLCYRFAKIDKEKFGVIENVTDKGYYTNSYHVDVREHIDAFSKFKFENQFQPISSGGCISYVEIPNLVNNVEAIEELVRFIYDNIQYAEFNTKTDFCHECGYDGEMKWDAERQTWYCPNCQNANENKLTVIRRTCGYLGEHYWNLGKTIEINSRSLHL